MTTAALSLPGNKGLQLRFLVSVALNSSVSIPSSTPAKSRTENLVDLVDLVFPLCVPQIGFEFVAILFSFFQDWVSMCSLTALDLAL